MSSEPDAALRSSPPAAGRESFYARSKSAESVSVVAPGGRNGGCYLKAELSASAVRHNLDLLRGLVGPDRKICAVVKADCYGHGIRTLLPVIAERADAVGVTTAAEAFTVRDIGYAGTVLMFFSACAYADGDALDEVLRELISRDVTLTIVCLDDIAPVAKAARSVGRRADVHLKIDSGMTRSGVTPEHAGELIAAVKRRRELRLAGLYTHLATADEADKTFAREQLKRFLSASSLAGKGLVLHAANSAGTIDLPETHLNMVRPGIAIYGSQPSDDMHVRLPLKPILKLTGTLMQVKDAAAGSSCGYGLTYRFDKPARTGLVPIGYADGYYRSLSNVATMRIRGRDVPVRGRISMDQTIVELTDLPDARVGDEVEILSNDPSAPNSVANIARLVGTIPYEITCRLGFRVRRVLVD